MTTTANRLTGIIGKLSPEEKAKLVIEDLFRDEPVLSPQARSKMLQAMGAEEGHRYNAFVDRYNRVKAEVVLLQGMANEAKVDLLERDRILWYHHVLEELADRLACPHYSDKEAQVGKVLLVDNPNLKPGKPLKLRLGFADLSLGVWGRKRRPYPPGNSPQVELRAPKCPTSRFPPHQPKRRG